MYLEEALRQHLATRSEPYRTLTKLTNSDVLTVDDSTIGAARACTIAREYGQEVTLFINPAQTARKRPYWFSRLDALLDARTVDAVEFDG